MMRSGGAEGYLKGKLTGPLEEGPKGSALLALPTKMKQAGGGKAASSGWNTLKEALRRCSALAAKAEVSYASISRHFSFIRSFLSPNIGCLSSARKDPGQSGTQSSQSLFSGLIRQWGHQQENRKTNT